MANGNYFRRRELLQCNPVARLFFRLGQSPLNLLKALPEVNEQLFRFVKKMGSKK
jgi:hypothetical protein